MTQKNQANPLAIGWVNRCTRLTPWRIAPFAKLGLLSLLFASAIGCNQGRIFSPMANRPMDPSGPSIHGMAVAAERDDSRETHPQDPRSAARRSLRRNMTNANEGVRVTSQEPTPETEIEPVPQRLVAPHPTARTAAKPPNHASGQDHQWQGEPDLSLVSYEESLSDNDPLAMPDAYAGVDVTELMSALQNAPPEVQKAAVARLIAMSRQRAKPSTHPASIDQALQACFDSLPTLPDEVIDRGVNPSRLAQNDPKTWPKSHQSPPRTADEQADQLIRMATNSPANGAAAQSTGPIEDVATAMMQLPIPTRSAADDLAESSQPDAADSTRSTAGKSSPSIPAMTASARMPARSDSDSSNPPESEAELPLRQAKTAPEEPADSAQTPRTLQMLSDAELFDALVERMQEDIPGESDADRHRRIVMVRHLMVLAGDPDRAVDSIQGLTTQEQEYLRHQLLALWTIIDPSGHPVPSRRFSAALPQIRQATQFLAEASDTLEVRSLEFCTEIEAYGQIKPFANRRFAAGQEVILYCEIENFVSSEVGAGFETRLQGSYDLIDSSGRRVATQTLPEDQQVSKNRLRDYFIAYQMFLPDDLDPGDYQLRLTMEDLHGKKYGQATLDLEIKR